MAYPLNTPLERVKKLDIFTVYVTTVVSSEVGHVAIFQRSGTCVCGEGISRIFGPKATSTIRLSQSENDALLFVWILTRDAEPEPEPEPEPTHFGRSRSRSRSRRNGSPGAGAGAGAVKNRAAPAPKRDTIVEKRNVNSEITNSRTNRLPIFFISNFRTSAMKYT